MRDYITTMSIIIQVLAFLTVLFTLYVIIFDHEFIEEVFRWVVTTFENSLQ